MDIRGRRQPDLLAFPSVRIRLNPPASITLAVRLAVPAGHSKRRAFGAQSSPSVVSNGRLGGKFGLPIVRGGSLAYLRALAFAEQHGDTHIYQQPIDERGRVLSEPCLLHTVER